MQSTIIYFWVYHITGDKLKLGLVGLSEVVPAILFSLFSGHFVDLNEKKKMLTLCISAYLLLGLGLFCCTTPFASHHLSQDAILYFIYTFIFIGGVIRAFYGYSSFYFVRELLLRICYSNA